MGKISQLDAATAARRIVEPIRTKITEIEKQISVKVTEWYTAQIPADVMKVFKGSNCDYVQTTKGVKLYENGFNDRSVSLIGQLPAIKPQHHCDPRFIVNKTQADAIHKLDEKKAKLVEQRNTTEREVESTILALATHKAVQEQFPEAYEFLPGMKKNTGLMVQLQPVRTKVQCLISENAEKKCIDKL
jgi:hypothetical protein